MTTTECITRQPTPVRTGSRSFWAFLSRINATSRQRQHLRRLDNAALKDIGLTRSQADVEASRPVWDVPASWLGSGPINPAPLA